MLEFTFQNHKLLSFASFLFRFFSNQNANFATQICIVDHRFSEQNDAYANLMKKRSKKLYAKTAFQH